MQTVFLITPVRPREDDSPERIRQSTMNCLAAAAGRPFPYPEACLVLEVGRRIASQFEFRSSVVTEDGVPLSSPGAWVTFLKERCAAGSVLCSEDGSTFTLGAFLTLPDVRRRAGAGVAPQAAPGEIEEAPP
ncbi:hypothetical protein DEIPH_ctg139orf0127 [Deinococcus phoenicis]|uniref:Uncharacterized protein n=1 Tax=Deinococcus phoenicis TaxID=1476583 RepID=A0A016QK87_9DEIO|nr:hypothetical protein [Deinococcus phoenicis]EYB66401.1 hypothetical protein DEIPH_ctg139orf0127 [Deinococcus phoenicis]